MSRKVGQPRARRVRRIARQLEQAYGQRQWRRGLNGLDGLIATILSQNTSGTNSSRAFARLKETFPTWQACLSAPVAQVEAAIRCGGLARRKARRIQALLGHIEQERGRLSLAFLGRWPIEQAREWLMRLDGVGPKTAACVLLFNFGRPALPVDTHVHRVSRRLGLIDEHVTAEAAHAILQAACPDECVYAFHVLLIAHGRQTCRARKPQCDQCVLARQCRWWQERKRFG